MKGAVEISAGVCHHLNLADVKLGAAFVHLSRILTAEIIRDHWRGQTLVGNHPVFDRMTEVDEHPSPLMINMSLTRSAEELDEVCRTAAVRAASSLMVAALQPPLEYSDRARVD